ncbi:NAD(P)/FAD-dependent oxidoreductase|uniref:NAD(P)/FAD-dependent oxidoreductase n=1 Tax=Stenotrophomonas sp. SbOxS2 TaxID=2723885 RepID=UPI0015D116D8|nr:NAD(P)/FAD-dependent oxidoreductase [Stenotrophomonas sp. SbOxS2]NYT99430.1 NAD(P)/FAD-dependent oxidoreductase [Stenotrophomonas sp. SbOxS2]
MNKHARPHRIVIVGGGVAGTEIASALGRRFKRLKPGDQQLSITLVDSDSAHVWKPMLHTIAAGTREVSQQQTPYLVLASKAGFDYQPGALKGLNRAAKEVVLQAIAGQDGGILVPERRLEYDTLVLAVGSQANDFGTPGVMEHCSMIDSRQQAMSFNNMLRERILMSAASGAPLSIAIVGGGATGVELAAELVQLTQSAVSYGAQALQGRVTVTLIEAGSKLLPAFPENISAATQARLESLGVKVLVRAKVNSVEPDALLLDDGNKLYASVKVWAAGIKAAPLLSELDGLETSRGNQLSVLPSLRTTRDCSIYAVGDCAKVSVDEGLRAPPPTAQVAHQQARYLVRHLPKAILQGAYPPDFHYRDAGSLVSLAEYDAYGSLGKFGFFKGTTIRGRLAQLGHVLLYRSHQARIHGFWSGSLLWLVDRLNARVRARIRLD